MKTTPEQDAQLRAKLEGKSPHEKLAVIKAELGLKNGREILKLRQLDPKGYEALCKAKQPERNPSRNPRMGGFTFRTVGFGSSL